MSEWTPGPWTAESEYVSDEYVIVASTAYTPEGYEEGEHPWVDPYSKANARLIAAAPEMAELLTEWASSPSYRPIRDSFEDDVKVLLARIKGES